MSEVTKILNALERGDSSASDDLLPLVYEELRALAAKRLNREGSDNSIQPTMLVHDAYLRLVDVDNEPQWNGKGHFFGAAAEAMRRILIEHARRKKSQKHGGDWRKLSLANVDPGIKPFDFDILDLNDALLALEQAWPQHANLVKLRFFAGLTIAEAAQATGKSHATVERNWAFSKAWLYDRLKIPDP